MSDYKYKCELCNYYTNTRQLWYQHNKTIKHKKEFLQCEKKDNFNDNFNDNLSFNL